MRLFSSTSILPSCDVRAAISGALLRHERHLATGAAEIIRTHHADALHRHGARLVDITADPFYGPLWARTLRVLVDLDERGYSLNAERVDRWATEWAREELTGIALRLVRLSAALLDVGVEVAPDDPGAAFLVIEGRHPRGSKVQIEVRRTLHLRGGRLRNEFPVAVRIDGRLSTAARLHEL